MSIFSEAGPPPPCPSPDAVRGVSCRVSFAFPTIVEQAVDELGWMFANIPERWHFAEYLTGLMVAERKNVSAINAEFAQTTGSILPEPLDHPGAVRRGTTQRTSFGLVAGSFLDALFSAGGDRHRQHPGQP